MSPLRNRIFPIVCALLVVPAALEGHGSAQTAGRRVVRGAEVTGVELGLEGALEVPRGGRLRWLVTAYDVVGLRELRVATEATVTLTSSLEPDASVVATTDRYGRAVVELGVAADAPDSFGAVLRLQSRSGVQRRFELSVRTTDPRALTLEVDRAEVPPGGLVRAFGRLGSADGRPLAQEVVRLTVRDSEGRPVATPGRLVTDRAGLFSARARLPRRLRGAVTVEARVGERERALVVTSGLIVGDPASPALVVAVAPEARVVRPGSRIPLSVVVRTAEGRPVAGAEVALEGVPATDAERVGRTDDRGRARLAFHSRSGLSAISDRALVVSAAREGLGTGRGSTTVRLAPFDHAAALAVEGGALVPSIGGRVWVRVVGADGRPSGAGVPVALSGPRLGAAGLRGVTDQDGVATFEVALAELPDSAADRCGGEGATGVEVRLAESTTPSLSGCVLLDPDGAARVRVDPPLATAGSTISVEVERARAAARLPVAIAALERRGDRTVAVSALVLPPGESRARIELPPDVVGELLVRARPIAPGGHEVRGGTASVWVLPGERAGLRARLDPAAGGRAELEPVGPSASGRSVYLVALPVDEALALAGRLDRGSSGPLGELRSDPATVGLALVAAALAAGLPRDAAAPGVLRGGEVLAVPAPDDAVRLGLLRDPFRARARFVTGRLALIFRAIEGFVAESVPERIDDVAVRSPRGGWDWNAQVLESVAASGELGGEGATGLGGEPLTIEALRELDPSFTYDAVARRVTRERLFVLLLALRGFVRDHEFDLPWSRLGEPATWLRGLLGRYVSPIGSIQGRHLVDGWGRPFVLRRAAGGRTRFGFVSPLPGWELLSTGPDGREGTADDLWDPTARVLAAAGPYAEAAGEDALVARLRGVELGRATVELLRSTGALRRPVSAVPERAAAASEQAARALWDRLPSVLVPEPDPLGLRRPARPGDGAAGRVVALGGARGAARVALGLDEEPRTWGLVAWSWTEQGVPSVASDLATGGAPVIVEGSLPGHLHANEPVTVDFQLTNVSDRPLRLGLELRGSGLVAARAAGEVLLAPGSAGLATLELLAAAAGADRVELVVVGEGGVELRRIGAEVRVHEGRMPVRLRAAGSLRDGTFRTVLQVPPDASVPVGRVVVLAPGALTADPELDEVRRLDPALTGWADAVAGRRLSPEQRSALLGAVGPDGVVAGRSPGLSTACAAVALASLGAEDEEAMAALVRLRGALGSGGSELDEDAGAAALRAAAATLAALAPGGVAELADAGAGAADPVAAAAAPLRVELRRAIHRFPQEPSLLARAAAALLLADPADAHGRAMLERAATSLRQLGPSGAQVQPSERRDRADERLAASMALAVAAHQAGDDDLAGRLLTAALPGAHLLARQGGEAAFWLLAAGAFGAMGTGEPERISLRLGGGWQPVALEGGRAEVPILELAAGRRTPVELRAEGGPRLLARVEAVMGRPFASRPGGPLRMTIEGDAGEADTLAGLELGLEAIERVPRPVVEVQLPAGVEAGPVVDRLAGAPGVVSTSAREPGFVRFVLQAMEAGTTRRLPLPLRWGARGELRGLGVVAFPSDRPDALSVLPPRPIVVR